MGRLVRDDIMATVTQITTRYNQGMQNTISERTIRRTLQQMGSSSRRPHRVPLLSAKNRKRRLQFSWWWWCNGVIFWHTLGSLVPIEHCLNICSSLYDYSVPIFWCYFQQDNAHVTKLKSSQTGFLYMTMSSLYSNGLQSPHLNPIVHLWDVVEREIHIMDVQPTNLQQLRDTIMSIWTKISEECFQHFVESMPQIIKAVLKAKGGPTRY